MSFIYYLPSDPIIIESSNIELGLFTDWDDVSNVEIRQTRMSRLKQAESYKVEILVPGRTDYTVGQKVNTMAALPFGLGACLDPFLNKM